MICLFHSKNSEQIISETWSQNNRSSEREVKKQIDGTNKKVTPRQENMTTIWKTQTCYIQYCVICFGSIHGIHFAQNLFVLFTSKESTQDIIFCTHQIIVQKRTGKHVYVFWNSAGIKLLWYCNKRRDTVIFHQLQYFILIWTGIMLFLAKKPSHLVWSGVIHQAYDFQHS